MYFCKLSVFLALVWPVANLVLADNNLQSDGSAWMLVDNFESASPLDKWILADPDNRTEPNVVNPQVTEVRPEPGSKNHYLIKKPAAEGVIGNRKALSFRKLPKLVKVGETYTFYTRVNIEYFPNNHSFGLSNLSRSDIEKHNYNAFEPMLRITDKMESNGYKNDGTLMVLGEQKGFKKIKNFNKNRNARPLAVNTWYEIWYVVNNAKRAMGGQRYDVYVRGGEFKTRQRVFTNARFRMQREQPLGYFITICNTGSKKQPYGNGGVRYDDIYMAPGVLLTTPIK